MKARWLVLVAAAAAVLFLVFSVQRPFHALRSSDIASATVHLIPPDKTFPISDTEALAARFSELAISRLPVSCAPESGQSVLFVLRMTDGSRREIRVCSSAVVIDGTGYRASPASCQALNRYANHLRTQAE